LCVSVCEFGPYCCCGVKRLKRHQTIWHKHIFRSISQAPASHTIYIYIPYYFICTKQRRKTAATILSVQ